MLLLDANLYVSQEKCCLPQWEIYHATGWKGQLETYRNLSIITINNIIQ